MPIIVCFEGQLAARPETTHPTTPTDVNTAGNTDGNVAEAVTSAITTAVVTVPPPPGSRSSRKAATTYHLRAHGHRALALARLADGDSVVVIGHVETEAVTDRNNSGTPMPAGTAAGRRTYRDTVVVDSIGTSLTPSTHAPGNGSGDAGDGLT